MDVPPKTETEEVAGREVPPPKTDPDDAVLRVVPKTDPEELLVDCVDIPLNMDPVAVVLDSVTGPAAEDSSSFIPPEEMILVDPPKTDPVDAICGVDPITELRLGDPPNIEPEEVGRDGNTEEET